MAEHRKPNDQSAGRRADAALPLGEREGGDTRGKAKALGRRERRNAGPDARGARRRLQGPARPLIPRERRSGRRPRTF